MVCYGIFWSGQLLAMVEHVLDLQFFKYTEWHKKHRSFDMTQATLFYKIINIFLCQGKIFLLYFHFLSLNFSQLFLNIIAFQWWTTLPLFGVGLPSEQPANSQFCVTIYTD